MGVDIRLHLYKSAQPDDVAKAISILAGNPHNPQYIGRKGVDRPYVRGQDPESGFFSARPAYKLEASGFAYPMGTLTFDAPADRHSPVHFCTVHLDTTRRDFTWLLIPPSTPFWIAVARRIVDTFGGALDHDDCDDVEADYFRFERTYGDGPQNDAHVNRQKAILALDALTGAEIEACRQFAAYTGMESYDAATA